MATALVTGASRGIGRAVALALARDGHDVAVAYASNAAAAEEVAAAIRALGRRAITAGADLADPAAADALVDCVEDGLGPVDVLVANAGVNTPGRRVEEIALEEWDRLHAVNLRAPFLLARRVLPGMEARGFGRIVLLSSVAAYTGGIIGAHYASSKAGLHGLAHSLSQQAAGAGVTVNVVAPALIESDMLPAEPEVRERLAASLPVGRLGTADEVADLVAAVVRNAFVTNQSFLADGGLHPT
jgi:3-oxoacyl-[acyl-carrier protein] reductase